MMSAAQSRIEQMGHVRQRYPRRATLRGGRAIELRLMDEQARADLLAFAWSLPPDDLLYLRADITDERVVDRWLANIQLNRTTTVLAYAEAEVIGEGSLTHSETDWTRHLGDIRIIVSPSARREGLGRFLAEEVFVIAELLGLKRLAAQMTHDQEDAQAVFQGLGFAPVAVLPGFVVARDGGKRDLLVMAYDLAAQGAPPAAVSAAASGEE